MLHWSIFLPLLIGVFGFGYGLGERNSRRRFEAHWQAALERMEREYQP